MQPRTCTGSAGMSLTDAMASIALVDHYLINTDSLKPQHDGSLFVQLGGGLATESRQRAADSQLTPPSRTSILSLVVSTLARHPTGSTN